MTAVKSYPLMFSVCAHNIDRMLTMISNKILRFVILGLWFAGFSAAAQAQDTGTQVQRHADEMIPIASGLYTPLYKSEGDSGRIAVPSFYIDRYPVTNADFLAFVTENPGWQRSRVKSIFADQTYLQHWRGDLDPGRNVEKSPVTNVSWFAARAYAKWKGKRLPTLAEWEYVASASTANPYGTDEPGFNDAILEWYSQPSPDALPAVGMTAANYWGVYDLHGLAWEWVSDFNSALITGESRADSGLERKLYCGSGSVGSSDVSNYAAFMRYAFRSSLKAQYAVANLGFRCAKDRAMP